MKATIKLGETEIKDAIRMYLNAKLGRPVLNVKLRVEDGPISSPRQEPPQVVVAEAESDLTEGNPQR